jgi:phage terminase large subunit-like protein
MGLEQAEKAITFIERLVHPEGSEWAGKPVVLMQHQKEYIRELLITNETGKRIIRQSAMFIPKKNAKTTLLAFLILWFLFSEKNGQIVCSANDKEQAGILYGMVKSIIEQLPMLDKHCKIYKGYPNRIECLRSKSVLNHVSSEAVTKNGKNCSIYVADEVGFFESSELWDAIESGQILRSQPLMIGISTAGEDRNSFGGRLYDKTKKILRDRSLDPTFLPVIYEAKPDADWTSPDVWYGCNPSLRELGNLTFIESQIRAVKEDPTQLRRILRYHLNIWIGSDRQQSWMPLPSWDACDGTIDLASMAGRTCDVGIDIASRNDMSCLMLLFALDDGRYAAFPRYYMPADTVTEHEKTDKAPYSSWIRDGFITAVPGDYMDSSQIRADLLAFRQQFNVRDVGIDQAHNATDLTKALQEDGFDVVWVGQGWRTIAPTASELGKLVASKRLVHNGNPVLRWNIENCRSKIIDDAGNEVPSKKRSAGRIDGVYALLDALAREIQHRPGGARPSISF